MIFIDQYCLDARRAELDTKRGLTALHYLPDSFSAVDWFHVPLSHALAPLWRYLFVYGPACLFITQQSPQLSRAYRRVSGPTTTYIWVPSGWPRGLRWLRSPRW